MDKKPAGASLPRWKKLALTLLVFVPALLVIELVLRLAGYGPAGGAGTERADETPGPTSFGYFAICDRQLGFRNRPNGSFRDRRIQGNPPSTTDRFGYRNGVGWTADSSGPIVLFVGDSFTFCSEVNDDRTGPSEVAKRLQRPDVRVLNAGVRGYGTLQAKRMMCECFARFPSIKVVVYTHCGNDLEENLVPNLRFPAKSPVVVVDDAAPGKFRAVEVSEPVVGWGESFLSWQPPPVERTAVGRLGDWLDARSAVCHQLIPWVRRMGAARLDSLDPWKIDNTVTPEQYDHWRAWAMLNGGYDAFVPLLKEMDRICRDHGAALVVTSVTCGLDPDLPDPRRFARVCDQAGVRFVSLEGQLTGDLMSYMSLRTDGSVEEHFGPRGTQAYAAALTPVVEEILRSQAAASRSDSASEARPSGEQ